MRILYVEVAEKELQQLSRREGTFLLYLPCMGRDEQLKDAEEDPFYYIALAINRIK